MSNEEPAEGLALVAGICDNPECSCELCHLSGYRLERTSSDRATRGKDVAFRARLDLGTGELSSPDGGPVDPAFAWTTEALTDDYRDWMRERFRRVKGQNDPAQLDLQLAGHLEEYAGGWLATYCEVYPHDWDLRMLLDGAVYWVHDSYCLNPTCTCRDVRLDFFDTHNPEPVGGVAVAVGAWREAKVEGGSLAHRLWKTFIGESGRKAKLRERFRKMRLAAQRVGELHETERPPEPARREGRKVGRNEPCPCGSGRKHKRCCGRPGARP